MNMKIGGVVGFVCFGGLAILILAGELVYQQLYFVPSCLALFMFTIGLVGGLTIFNMYPEACVDNDGVSITFLFSKVKIPWDLFLDMQEETFPFTRSIVSARKITPFHLLYGLIYIPGRQDNAEAVTNKFHPIFPCIAEDGSGAFNNYKVRTTPFAFVVGEDSRVRAKGLCNDAMRLQELLITAGLARTEIFGKTSRLLQPQVSHAIKEKEAL
jgi:hypothetical protein